MAGTADLVSAYAALTAARPAYIKAQAYYDGDVDELFASDAIARLLAKSHLEEIDEVNFARIPVTAVLNRLHINAITTGNDVADAAIADLAQANQLDLETPGLHERACSLGDAYLLVWPELDDAGEVTGVTMSTHSPSTVRIIYDPEYPLRKLLTIKSWQIGQGKTQQIRADLYYDDRIERYVYTGKYNGKRDGWQPFEGDGQPSVIDNPWGMPWFHFRAARRPYGRPEHYAAYGPQTIINKLVIAHAATVDYQSLPQRYGLIDPALDQPGQQADFDPDWPEDTDADPESPRNPSQLRSDPGEFWQLQGYKQVGQFAAAEPGIFMVPFDRYIKAMAQVTDTPMHLFDATGDQLSGRARREAAGPLHAKVQSRQREFGAAWADVWEFALHLLGLDDISVTVRWQSAEVVTDAEGWATVAAKIAAGVPRDQALIEAGYEPDQVEAWLQATDDITELGRRADLLDKIGVAVQALGTGMQLGAVTQEQVSALLSGVLGATESLSTPGTP